MGEYKVPIIIFSLVALCLGVAFMSVKEKVERENRLMAECIKERKEYECYSLIKKSNGGGVHPILIHTGGR